MYVSVAKSKKPRVRQKLLQSSLLKLARPETTTRITKGRVLKTRRAAPSLYADISKGLLTASSRLSMAGSQVRYGPLSFSVSSLSSGGGGSTVWPRPSTETVAEQSSKKGRFQNSFILSLFTRSRNPSEAAPIWSATDAKSLGVQVLEAWSHARRRTGLFCSRPEH